MIHRVLNIGRWVVDFLFSTTEYDVDGVLACLYDVYAPRYVMEKAERMMESGEANTGFTYTNPKLLRAVVAVGPTSSGSEFIDTIVHEIHHLAVAIAENLGMDLEGENPAYISGDAARSLAEVVCALGCEHCNG